MTLSTFTFQGPYFRADEAAAYLHYRGKHATRSLRKFVAARGIPTFRRNRCVLIRKADLDKAIGAHGVTLRAPESHPVTVASGLRAVPDKKVAACGS